MQVSGFVFGDLGSKDLFEVCQQQKIMKSSTAQYLFSVSKTKQTFNMYIHTCCVELNPVELVAVLPDVNPVPTKLLIQSIIFLYKKR